MNFSKAVKMTRSTFDTQHPSSINSNLAVSTTLSTRVLLSYCLGSPVQHSNYIHSDFDKLFETQHSNSINSDFGRLFETQHSNNIDSFWQAVRNLALERCSL